MFSPNSPYPPLYKGYFDDRDPYSRNLEEIYQKPLPIPIYGIDELFNSEALQEQCHLKAFSSELVCLRQDALTCSAERMLLVKAQENKVKQLTVALENRDLDIFKYFHFVAARLGQFDALKEKYWKYYQVCQDLVLRGGGMVQEICWNAKKDLLDFQSNLEEERKMAILNTYQ